MSFSLIALILILACLAAATSVAISLSKARDGRIILGIIGVVSVPVLLLSMLIGWTTVTSHVETAPTIEVIQLSPTPSAIAVGTPEHLVERPPAPPTPPLPSSTEAPDAATPQRVILPAETVTQLAAQAAAQSAAAPETTADTDEAGSDRLVLAMTYTYDHRHQIWTIEPQSSPTQLPYWARQESFPLAGPQVFKSERFSSLENVEQDLYARAWKMVQPKLYDVYPQTYGWYPTLAQFRDSGIVQFRTHLTYALPVGEFTEHFYEGAWSVDPLDPQGLLRLQMLWRADQIGQRVWHVILGGGGFSLVLLGIGLLLRRSCKAGC